MRFLRVTFVYLIFFLVLLVSPSLVKGAVNTDSMVGYWKFDETAQGSTVTDSSGDGHSGTPLGGGGGPNPTTDMPTTSFPDVRALDFDGNDYIEVADNSDFDESTFTVAFWVKFDTINSTHRTLVAKWDVGVRQQYTIQLTSGNVIGFWTGNGGVVSSGALTSVLTPSTGTWYHITAVADGANRALYINGTDNKYTGTGTVVGDSNVELTMASKRSSGGAYFEFLDGKMDDVRFYTRVLSDDEVDELAAGDRTTANWDGSDTTDYEDLFSWDIEAVPDPYTNVVIPDTFGQDPEMSEDVALYTLTIDPDAAFTTNCYSITYNDGGSLTNNGTFNDCPQASPSSTSSIYHPPPGFGPSGCNDQTPSGTPDLFRVDAAGTYVNLYFTTVSGASGYNVNYGLDESANQYGDNFSYSTSEWTAGRQVNGLSPNTTYYFKVQPSNGCVAGNWSKTIQVKTKGQLSNVTQFFANLKPFSSNPALVTSESSGQAVARVTKTPGSCSYTVKGGDSLWNIALAQLGSGTKYSEIMQLNPGISNGSTLKIGQTLILCK